MTGTSVEALCQCPNGCGPAHTKRGGVGHLTITGYSCSRCNYSWKPDPRPSYEWQPDRSYAAGYSYASGCAE